MLTRIKTEKIKKYLGLLYKAIDVGFLNTVIINPSINPRFISFGLMNFIVWQDDGLSHQYQEHLNLFSMRKVNKKLTNIRILKKEDEFIILTFLCHRRNHYYV